MVQSGLGTLGDAECIGVDFQTLIPNFQKNVFSFKAKILKTQNSVLDIHKNNVAHKHLK